MENVTLALAALLALVVLVLLNKVRKLRDQLATRGNELTTAKTDAETQIAAAAATAKKRVDEQTERAAAASAEAKRLIDEQRQLMAQEVAKAEAHFQAQALQRQAEAAEALADALRRLETLQHLQGVADAEGQAVAMLTQATEEAAALRSEAATLLQLASAAALQDRTEATRRAKDVREQADALLDHATREAARIVEEAHTQATTIGGDAYIALRDKEHVEQALTAIRNVVEGYGDRYIVPTRSLLDDLAAEFGHTEAGRALTSAREQTKRMVEEGHAAQCDYAETTRRETAIRFVIDAFNGRVDAILSRARHDNFGTLTQEIRDAFAMVNHNGEAFRNARVLPSYLDARLAELKWAVVVHELRVKEREEQRRIKEQMREEEKARREYERAIEVAAQEEKIIQRALEQARAEAAVATAEQQATLNAAIEELSRKLAEAEAKNQRALSMAQQTRKGTVYVVSNVGSFGDEVFKIGMTRRLEPADRIKELSDASVPFEFDVHAMIACDDAPKLEAELHAEFEDLRLNKVNYRKEFFRLPIDRLRGAVANRAVDVSFTMVAEAREYRESVALSKMSPEEREKYSEHQDMTLEAE
jgi:DNA repair exonuclease SbcCD ATPase subunit